MAKDFTRKFGKEARLHNPQGVWHELTGERLGDIVSELNSGSKIKLRYYLWGHKKFRTFGGFTVDKEHRLIDLNGRHNPDFYHLKITSIEAESAKSFIVYLLVHPKFITDHPKYSLAAKSQRPSILCEDNRRRRSDSVPKRITRNEKGGY